MTGLCCHCLMNKTVSVYLGCSTNPGVFDVKSDEHCRSLIALWTALCNNHLKTNPLFNLPEHYLWKSSSCHFSSHIPYPKLCFAYFLLLLFLTPVLSPCPRLTILPLVTPVISSGSQSSHVCQAMNDTGLFNCGGTQLGHVTLLTAILAHQE